MTAQRIIQHIFKEPGLEKVTQWELEKLVSDYPYFTPARVLLAKRAYQRSSDLQHEAVIKALLYTNTPHYFYQFVQAATDATAATSYTVTGGHSVEAENIATATFAEPTAVETASDFLQSGPEVAGAFTENEAAFISAPFDGEIAAVPEAEDLTAQDIYATTSTLHHEGVAASSQEELPVAPDLATGVQNELPAIVETPLVVPEEVGAGAFNAIAPEITIALQKNITPANEAPVYKEQEAAAQSAPVKSFQEAMEAFNLSLAAQAPVEEAAPTPVAITPVATIAAQEAPVAETPAATPVAEGNTSDFHKRMEAFRRSLEGGEDPVSAPAVTPAPAAITAVPENIEQAPTANTEATAITPEADDTTLLSGFNVNTFQEELEAIRNRMEIGTPPEVIVDNFQAAVEHNTTSTFENTLEAGAVAASEELAPAGSFHVEVEENATDAIDATLETGAFAATHAAPEFRVDTVEAQGETAVHETLEAGAIAAGNNVEDALVSLPAFTEETISTPSEHFDASDIQLVSDAINNDQLPSAPLEHRDDEYTAPRITTWMPAQHRTYHPSDEEAPETTHASVTLPAASTPIVPTETAFAAAEVIAPTEESAFTAAALSDAEAIAPIEETAFTTAALSDAEAIAPTEETVFTTAALPEAEVATTTEALEATAFTAALPAEEAPVETAPVHFIGTELHAAQVAFHGDADVVAPIASLHPEAVDHAADETAPPTTDTYEEGPIKIYPLEMPDESETALTFQPLYTDDYFAYKKLQEPQAAEALNEKGASEMKSFTNWLRVMKDSFAEKSNKDWYHEQLHRVYEEDEETGISERVEKMALQSITLNDDIVSETLAEIWAKQRQHQKAIQIYKKLSLLNPGKSAYFAQKINELQSDINK